MKKIFYQLKCCFAVVLFASILPGCLKDTCTQKYTLYYPVYKTSGEVRSNIKSNGARDIKIPGKLFVFGNYIFLNEVDKGIHIIDNSNPAAPVNKYFIDIPGNMDLAVKGNTLYADLYTDMVTLDISNPQQVVVKKIIDDAFPFRRYSNGFISDTAKIIVDWVAKDTMVTVDCGARTWRSGRFDMLAMNSSFSSASAAPATQGVGGSMARFTILNNYLYTVTDNVLNSFNISQPQEPVFSSKVNLTWGIETIFPFKNNLFIGSTTGMFIYGTSNPAQPNSLGAFTHARTCDPVIAEDNYAFVTLRSGNTCGGFTNQLDVVNIQNLMSPKLVKSYSLHNPFGLSKDGNVLIICDGSAGLKVFDATDINSLKLAQTISGIDTYDVITQNGRAIVVAKDGLYQYSYTMPTNLKLLSKITYQ
ncbi:hypothetical protein EXU57_05720 [Segetibacter sp. 3557_3]|uniref:LVIVD repeat-containing protein n=1 Tax=Segetibacter sp. 3557_3 TaxID=2547429 RepID=UPI001058455B|nr:hypothetical protein [Segetibacter sp. 3557_3]TDH27962.1 hypothetical protein EXU57_05720 [Segetibacter sp. 3557_3]